LNRLTRNIRAFNFGLSNRSGSQKMIALKKKNYIQSGGYSFYIPKRKIHKNEIIEHYKSKIGDSVIKFKNKNIIIKIDVEGFEEEILAGAMNTIKINKPVLVIEQQKHEYKNDIDEKPAIAILEGWGYQVIEQFNKDWVMKYKG
jgi:FkbM family methyltransferase